MEVTFRMLSPTDGKHEDVRHYSRYVEIRTEYFPTVGLKQSRCFAAVGDSSPCLRESTERILCGETPQVERRHALHICVKPSSLLTFLYLLLPVLCHSFRSV
jgi:hypothetical protein